MRGVWGILLLLAGAGQDALACTTSAPPPTQVASSFAVQVKLAGRPLSGATVTLRGADTDIALTSRADGSVTVPNLRPGNYWIGAEMLGAWIGGEQVFISRSAPRAGKKRLTFEFRAEFVPSVERGAGVAYNLVPGEGPIPIIRFARSVRVPAAGVVLRLENVQTREHMELVTGQQGEYAFSGVSDGLYVLRAVGGPAGSHWANETAADFVRVDRSASKSRVVWTASTLLGSCSSGHLSMFLE